MIYKRERRTKQAIDEIKTSIYAACAASNPRTIRGLFYHLVGTGLIEKNEVEYKRTVVRLCTEMREKGELPWEWIVDGTRWMRKSPSFNSVQEARERTARIYRRNLWREQNRYVEVWCEKATLAGLIVGRNGSMGCTLMYKQVSPQLDSYTTLRAYENMHCKTFIYYLGDYDRLSGMKIWQNTQPNLGSTWYLMTS